MVSSRLAGRGGPRQGRAGTASTPRRASTTASMMRLGHLPGQGKTEPHAFGLAGHERVEQRRLHRRRRTRARVADLDDPLTVGLRQVEHDAIPPGPAASIALSARFSTAPRRLGSSSRGCSSERHRQTTSSTRQCSQVGSTREATSWISRTRSHRRVGPLLDPAQREQAADLLLDQRELAEGHRHARVSPAALAPLDMKLNAHTSTGDAHCEAGGPSPRRAGPAGWSARPGGSSGSSAEAGRTSG